MNAKDLLKSKIRPVTEEDRKILPVYSYSGLSTLKHCPYQFNLRYNEEKRTDESSLAMELGTLLHYILEQKGYMIKEGNIDYNILSNILQNGAEADSDKSKEHIKGLKELKKQYWETWGVPDSEGRNYNEKIELFLKVLSDEMQNDEWSPYAFEMPFEFVYDDKIILMGFIDRVDVKGDEYRVVDYKTNKKPFADKDLPTSLQFGIYALAILNEYDIVPTEYQYRLILLDMVQNALTLGWEKRIIAALDKLIKLLDECQEKNEWIPKPTPLCHWCSYCKTNSDAKQYKNECPYYSLWTPEAKTFEVNQRYGESPSTCSKDTNKTLDNCTRNVVF